MTSPVLVLDGSQLKISGTITDASNDASLVSGYEVRVYESSTLIAKGTVTDKTLTDTALAFPTEEGLESKAQGLSDDEERRADKWNLTGTWEDNTLKISGDIEASTLESKKDGDGAGSLPIFMSVPLNGANGIKITTDTNNFYKCQTDNDSSMNVYKDKGETDMVNDVVYLKFGKTFATKTEETWFVSPNRTFVLQVYKEMDGDLEGILVAECTFTIDFSGIKIIGQN